MRSGGMPGFWGLEFAVCESELGRANCRSSIVGKLASSNGLLDSSFLFLGLRPLQMEKSVCFLLSYSPSVCIMNTLLIDH